MRVQQKSWGGIRLKDLAHAALRWLLTRAERPLPRIQTMLPLLSLSTFHGTYVHCSLVWTAWIAGPVGTPYEGGIFNLLINFPEGALLRHAIVACICSLFWSSSVSPACKASARIPLYGKNLTLYLSPLPPRVRLPVQASAYEVHLKGLPS